MMAQSASHHQKDAKIGSIAVLVVSGLLALGVAFLVWVHFKAKPYEGPVRHIILISLDTVRADKLGCYGNRHIQTPNIDALAADGIRFDQVVTAAPTTLASHTSIMTGTYPHTHGVPRNGFKLDERNETLAEVLKAASFETAAFIGAFALDSSTRFNQGFDVYDEDYQVLAAEMGDGQNQRRADRVTDTAIAYLSKSVQQRSFMFVHYFDAHAPYDPPVPYDNMYPRKDIPVPHNLADGIDRAVEAQQRQTIGRVIGKTQTIIRGLDPELILKVRSMPVGDDLALDALYRGEISFADHHLGRFIATLKEKGIYDDALIILTADHGETMWEHADFWNHGLWVYDTTVRVPLIVKLPKGEAAGATVNEVVSTTDIMPTILALLERDIPNRVEGVSLVPAFQGKNLHRGSVYSEATQPYWRGADARPWPNKKNPKCVRRGDYKYIYAPYLEMEELYNIQRDPRERNNLLRSAEASAEPTLDDATRDILAELSDLLAAWREGASSFTIEQDSSERTNRNLDSLGYVGSSDTRSSDKKRDPKPR